MIVMSDDFKKSVSATEREMKGYVEVSFVSSADKSGFTIDTAPEILQIGGVDIPDTGLLDDDRKGKNYASLEQDYFLLDGTFVLPNNDATKNPGMGYISKYAFGEQQEEISEVNPFHFTTNAIGCSGITVYFQNNVPIDLEITVYSNGTFETFTNIDITDTGIASVTFSERDVTDLYIVVNDMLYSNRRLRVQEIDFGLSAIYEGEDLISFKTIEQCNRFGSELPINECDVVIGDYDNKFDIINPKGITQFLTQNVIIKPFVGVVTEDNGIEYCPMGVYWLDNWNKESNSVTINGKNIISKLQENNFYFPRIRTRYLSDYLELWQNKWNVIFDYEEKQTRILNPAPKTETKAICLKKMAICFDNIIICDRLEKNKIKIKENNILNLVPKLKINLSIMKEPENIIINDKIEKITSKMYYWDRGDSVDENIYNVTLNSNGYNVFAYDFETAVGASIKMLCDNYNNLQILDSNYTILDNNGNIIYNGNSTGVTQQFYVKYNYIGNVTFDLTKEVNYNYKDYSIEKIYDLKGTKQIDIDNDFITNKATADVIMNNCYNNYLLYKSLVDFNGNPTIECGDCIEIENKYSTEEEPLYDKVWVTKIESEFKGSFNQTIEGDIIEN